MRNHLAVALVIFSLAGCASYERQPVPVFGDPEELDQLAGEWLGSYQSAETGRSGSIASTFRKLGPSMETSR